MRREQQQVCKKEDSMDQMTARMCRDMTASNGREESTQRGSMGDAGFNDNEGMRKRNVGDG